MARGGEYTVDELADATGMSVRNIRSYRSRGLLHPPRMRGRVGYYGAEHLTQLRLVQALLQRGLSLAVIGRLVERGETQSELARLVRDDGLTVLFVTHDLEEAIYLGDRVIALQANPGPGRPSLARMIDVQIPRPRDQLSTKEHPEFVKLRRELFAFIEQSHD